MTKESVVRCWSGVTARAVLRIAVVLRAWPKSVMERRRERLGQRRIDRMSDHMLRDTGLSRWNVARREVNWLSRK